MMRFVHVSILILAVLFGGCAAPRNAGSPWQTVRDESADVSAEFGDTPPPAPKSWGESHPAAKYGAIALGVVGAAVLVGAYGLAFNISHSIH